MRWSAVFRPFLVVILVLAGPAFGADSGKLVLGSDNQVFKLEKGTYGELFAESEMVDGANPVLALDVLAPDGSRERLLVPGTETIDAESSEFLIFERESNQAFLLWETLANGIHPLLHLTSFDGSNWGEQIEIISSPFSSKGSPQLAVSRLAATDTAAELAASEALTVLHLVWWEERPGSSSAKRYAPIFLVNGDYLGWTPILDLGALSTSDSATADTPVSPGIVDAVRVQIGMNSHSCVIGFLDPATHRLVTLEIVLLHQALGGFADILRGELIPLGSRNRSLSEVTDEIVARILELGAGSFHEATLTYIANQVRQLIGSADEEVSEDELARIADRVAAEIVTVGAEIEEGGLADREDSQVLQIASPWDDAAPRHLLKVSRVSDRAAPEVDGPATLWLSESGRHVLVSWESEEGIFYTESLAEGWSETSFLEPSPELGREQIYRTLAERVRNR